MNTTSQKYIEIRDNFIYTTVIEKGYSSNRNNDRYRRVDGDIEYDISIFFQMDSLLDAGELDICAGVGFRSIFSVLSQVIPYPGMNAITHAGIGGRVLSSGAIPQDIQPDWSWIDRRMTAEEFGLQVRSHFLDYIFPFLDEASNVNVAMQYWESEHGPVEDKYPLAVAYLLKKMPVMATRVLANAKEQILRLGSDSARGPSLKQLNEVDSLSKYFAKCG